LSTEKIQNSLLALMLTDVVLQADLKPVCVDLLTGLLTPGFHGTDRFVYFPVDALMTLGSGRSADAALAVVGLHGCVAPGPAGGSSTHAHVVVPGQAYRIDWAPVADDPERYAAWLWHTAAATQRLIRQMVQWSFCAQHHTGRQHLASWLLHCMAQYPRAHLNFHLHALPMSIRHLLALSGAHNASGFDVHEGHVHVTSPRRLAEQACSCYQKMVGADAA
jgi:hypothetical protein